MNAKIIIVGIVILLAVILLVIVLKVVTKRYGKEGQIKLVCRKYAERFALFDNLSFDHCPAFKKAEEEEIAQID